MKPLSPAQRATLAAFCDTLLPRTSARETPISLPSASEASIPGQMADVLETGLGDRERCELDRLLRALESPGINLLLGNHAAGLSALTPAERADRLEAWAHSRWPGPRVGFQSLKRLAAFLYFGQPLDRGTHVLWSLVGYGPSTKTDPAIRHTADSLRFPDPETTECDVVIVGSGAGGSLVADAVVAAGYRAVVLESGGWAESGKTRRSEVEGYREMYVGRGLASTSDYGFLLLAGATLGGSTTINWMTCLRPLRVALREWAEGFGVEAAAGPAFEDHLAAVENRLEVSTRESQVNPANEVLRRGALALGYQEGSDFELLRRNGVGCSSRCEPCAFGCPYGAKRTGWSVYLRTAVQNGALVYLRTRATQIVFVRGKARGVRAVVETPGGPGREIEVRGRAVVLAAGALSTPALLLASGVHVRGVGRGLRLDPTTAIIGEFPERIRMWEGPMQTIAVRRLQHADPTGHAAWIESAPAHPGLSALGLPWHDSGSYLSQMSRLDHAASSIVLVRDHSEGRIVLDRDSRPVYHYRLDRRDRRNLAKGLVEAARIHYAAGARRIQTLHHRELSVGDGRNTIPKRDFVTFEEEIQSRGVRTTEVTLFSAHPMGGARFGVSSRNSAAVPTGEVRNVEGLWVADGSLIPTAPGVNPMITIYALARLVSEHLLGFLSGTPRPVITAPESPARRLLIGSRPNKS